MGGAIGSIPGIDAAIPSFISGISSQSIGMAAQNLTGSANYSFNEFMTSTIFSGITSVLFAGVSKTIKINGNSAILITSFLINSFVIYDCISLLSQVASNRWIRNEEICFNLNIELIEK